MQALLDNYVAVLLAAVVGSILVTTALIAARVLAPFSQSKQKSISYECGMLPVGRVRTQIHIRYYLFAILFLIFDVEAVFLFPWAVTSCEPATRPSTRWCSSSSFWAAAWPTPGRRGCCNGSRRRRPSRRRVTETSTPRPPRRRRPSRRPSGPKTGVERELELLTPVEVDHGKALYRQVLPGIIQVPAETSSRSAARTRSGR